jgi:hypothetical protein
MTREQTAAEWLRVCEEAFRRAQQGGCPARYRAALLALERAERIALVLLAERTE